MSATLGYAGETFIADESKVTVTGIYTVTAYPEGEDNEGVELSKEVVTTYTYQNIVDNIQRCDAYIEEYKRPGKFQAGHNTKCVKKERKMWKKYGQAILDKQFKE